MKFARYLEDTQTPEWKKAYMDYRLLKKRISAIRNERREFEDVSDTPTASRISLAPSVPYTSDQHGTASLHGQGGGRATSLDVTAGGDSGRPSNATARTSVVSMPETLRSEQDTTPVLSGSGSGARQATLGKRLGATRGMLRRNKSTSTAANLWRPSKSLSLSTSQLPPSSLPFVELYDSLSPAERAFFDALQGELDKVEAFYLRQEQEMRVRFFKLQKQLEELGKHRKAFHQTFDTTRHSPWPLNPLSDTVKIKRGRIKIYKEHDQIPDAPMLRRELSTPHYGPGSVGSTSPKGLGSSPKGAFNVNGKGKSPEEGLARVDENGESQGKRGKRDSFNGSTSLGEDGSGIPAMKLPEAKHTFEPEDYVRAKKRLRKAAVEHYRGLETLQNYRILNVTGFRKALKKFEKNTGIPAQLTWMAEKIDSGVLGSGASVRSMLSDMEMLFTEKFEHGNKKQALSRLRAHSSTKTHHFSTFSTGLAVGLAIPALIDGIRESYHPNTREAIPSWGALLYVYATLMVPTVFALLLGLNILVWSRYRINYVFIFELDVRSRLDARQYFELPAVLLATLCYAFWFSFARIGAPEVAPTTWPGIWMLLAVMLLIDPLPILYKKSRYWTLRNLGRLLLPGTRRVEFTDFWLADQLCSLTFSLANLVFVACVYDTEFRPGWNTHCGVRGPLWGVSLALNLLPLLVRLIQCIRRYVDSKLYTHLINAGKYAMGMVAAVVFFYWRHTGQGRGAAFILWCLTSTMYSLYAGAWDYLMDWSILQPHVEYKGLRADLVYSDHPFLYHVAIVTNTCIRFIWVIYIPHRGPNVLIRSFLVACLEALRRVQWNFYRVEAEFIGHMDQFRVTRDVPLPYVFDEGVEDEQDLEETPVGTPWQRLRAALGRAANPLSSDEDTPTK